MNQPEMIDSPEKSFPICLSVKTEDATSIASNFKTTIMNNNKTLEKRHQIQIFGMHDAFKTSLENAPSNEKYEQL